MKTRARITTGQGDSGRTRLFSGEEVPKDAPALEALGDLDELVCLLGVARCHARRQSTRDALLALQRRLFDVGAELATSPDKAEALSARVNPESVEQLEKQSLILEALRRMPEDFVVPGSTPAAAHLDLARAVARRCERRVAALCRDGGCRNPHLPAWMNRLSDYLWLLARSEETSSIPRRAPEEGIAE